MGDINKEVIALLDKYGSDHKRALKENKKLEYLYALSVLRENLLEWYGFRAGSRLLQAGADYGALTGLFAERTGNVTVLDESEESLDVVRKRFETQEEIFCVCDSLTGYAEKMAAEGTASDRDGRYDYVTLIGSLREPCEDSIEAAKKCLKPGGILLLAACNRFGMKYFAGAGRDECSITKNRVDRLLPGGAVYYPMPDYRLPSTIYSDKYLPKKGDLTDVLAVYDYPKYLLMDVGEAFDAVCEDGQFENFANSFLVIWEKGE